MKSKRSRAGLAVFLLAPVLLAAEQPPAVDDDVDPKDWGIQNNCIRTNRINSIKFIDEQVALIEIPHNKIIKMTLKRRCPGVKDYGISYKTRTGSLCARMDFITSLHTQFNCQIESFEPYLMLDESAAELDEAAEGESAEDANKRDKQDKK